MKAKYDATMADLLQFYADLAVNNNKPWFDKHKELYLSVKEFKDNLAMEIYQGLQQFDKDLTGLSIKDITYRIYQDLRFHDRPPYKTWVGIYVAKKGKNSPYAGYYLHIEPCENRYFICSGLYREDKLLLKSVREDILVNGKEFDRTIKVGKGWEIDWDGALKRVPNEYPSDDKYSEYFKLKHFLVIKDINEDYLLAPNLASRVCNDFKATHSFVKMLNNAVDFALEEWN